MRKPKQLALCLPLRGGKRRGAGRKPKGERALVSHAARAKFVRATPVHVTLRVAGDIPSLRSSRRFTTIRRCLAATRGRFGLRLVEFNVLDNHLHLIVEADADHALSVGMQGLAIRLAKALNAALGRHGSVFADHYHSHLLLTPTELTRAIRYVVENDARHYGGKPVVAFSSRAGDALDLFSSARSWLVRIGWQRAPPGVRIEPIALRALE